MKKRIVSLLLLTTMSLGMVACGSTTADQDTKVEESVTAFSPSEFVTAVDASIIEEETLAYMVLDSDMIEMTYAITPDMYTEIEARMPMMNVQCDELVVLLAADGQVETITAALEARQAYLADPANMGYPEHIEFANDYKLYVDGNFVVFAMGLHADKAVNVYEGN